jgi:hypothetical protein
LNLDVVLLLGETRFWATAPRVIRFGASAWTGWIAQEGADRRISGSEWPLGACGAAALAAGEVFKASMRKLCAYAASPNIFERIYAPSLHVSFELAPEATTTPRDLGAFDIISGGAITHALLFALARIPGVKGEGRVIECDTYHISNANRYSLLRLSRLHLTKAADLARSFGGLKIEPLECWFEAETIDRIRPLATRVLVGVDSIRARWAVQKEKPSWLGVGATSHFNAMTSIHTQNLPCVGCLHSSDDIQRGPIPTVAFVSFWAGLHLATRFVTSLSTEPIDPRTQQLYFSPLRPDGVIWLNGVARRSDCPCQCSTLWPRGKAA